MRRRDFITLLGTAAAWPLAARAQQPAKVPRVGILSPAASETAGTLTAFREGIRDLGYIEGQTIALDFRLSHGIMDALPALAAELVRIHHFRQAAGYVDRIIRGTKPGDLPLNASS